MMLIPGCEVKGINYMEQSPWDANRSLTSQETPYVLWKLKVHDHVHVSLTRVPVLSQINFM
jgi:hypothetical protein